MEEKIKVVFEKPYKDYTVGQEVEFEGRGNVTLANWCIANGLASVYEKSTKKSGCAGCDNAQKSLQTTIEELTTTLAEKETTIDELTATLAEKETTIDELTATPSKTKKDETTD